MYEIKFHTQHCFVRQCYICIFINVLLQNTLYTTVYIILCTVGCWMKAAMVLGIMEDDDEKLRIKRDVLNNKNAGCNVD